MEIISANDAQKKYGIQNPYTSPQGGQSGYGGEVSQAFQGGLNQFKEGMGQALQSHNPLSLTEAGLKEGAGLINAAFSPAAPLFNHTVGAGVEFAANKISDIPAVQKFAQTGAGQATSRVAEDIGNTSELLQMFGAPEVGGRAATGVGDTLHSIGDIKPPTLGPAGDYIKSAYKDIAPDSQRLINHTLSRALDLTPSDLKNLHASTGNDVGTWMADNNLIGRNKGETQQLIQNFFQQNYKGVRTEIAKADATRSYSGNTPTADSIPGYKAAVAELTNKTKDIPGMEKNFAEISQLAGKKNPTLEDVQKVKELLDEHYTLYKVTGDVAENIAKQGLANIRSKLKGYIEKSVKDATGADIKKMNNDVQTARGLNDAITARDPRGLTRANLTLRDLYLGGFGYAVGGPVGAGAAIVLRKVFDSPTVKLRFARWLDARADKAKANAIMKSLQSGTIPPEAKQFAEENGLLNQSKNPMKKANLSKNSPNPPSNLDM